MGCQRRRGGAGKRAQTPPRLGPVAESTGRFARQPAQAAGPNAWHWDAWQLVEYRRSRRSERGSAKEEQGRAFFGGPSAQSRSSAVVGAVVGVRAGKADATAAAAAAGSDRVADEEKAKAEALAAAAKAQQAEADLKAEEARKADEDKKAAGRERAAAEREPGRRRAERRGIPKSESRQQRLL